MESKVWELSTHLQEHITGKVEEYEFDGQTERTFQAWSFCSERILLDSASHSK